MKKEITLIERGIESSAELLNLSELIKIKGGFCISNVAGKDGIQEYCGIRIGGIKWCIVQDYFG
jgi:hypothetical protein